MGKVVPLLALAIGLCVGGCTQASPEPVASTPEASSPPDEVTIEVIPEFVPGGSARDNLPYIDWVLTTAGAGTGLFGSLDAVAALENAGFDRADMEVTSDRTSLELAAESITIAVVVDGECALGQWSTEWYVSSVTPVLGAGTCLLGDTLSLD